MSGIGGILGNLHQFGGQLLHDSPVGFLYDAATAPWSPEKNDLGWFIKNLATRGTAMAMGPDILHEGNVIADQALLPAAGGLTLYGAGLISGNVNPNDMGQYKAIGQEAYDRHITFGKGLVLGLNAAASRLTGDNFNPLDPAQQDLLFQHGVLSESDVQNSDFLSGFSRGAAGLADLGFLWEVDPTAVAGRGAMVASYRRTPYILGSEASKDTIPLLARKSAVVIDSPAAAERYSSSGQMLKTLEWMQGKSAPEIARLPFVQSHPERDVLATYYAQAKTLDQRKMVTRLLVGDTSVLSQLEAENAQLADTFWRQQQGLLSLRSLQDPDLYKVTDRMFAGYDDANIEQRVQQAKKAVDETYGQIKLNEARQAVSGSMVGQRTPTVGLTNRKIARDIALQDGTMSRPVRLIQPAITMRPQTLVDVNRGDSSIQIERYLAKSGMSYTERTGWLQKYMAATSPQERNAIFQQMDEAAIGSLLNGLSKDDIASVQAASRIGKSRAMYAVTNRERNYDGSGRDLISFVDDNGTVNEIHMPLLASQTADWMVLSDLDEVKRLVKLYDAPIKQAIARGTSVGDYYLRRFYDLWKPAALLRFGFPQRVVGDEQLRIMAKIGIAAQGNWLNSYVDSKMVNSTVRGVPSATSDPVEGWMGEELRNQAISKLEAQQAKLQARLAAKGDSMTVDGRFRLQNKIQHRTRAIDFLKSPLQGAQPGELLQPGQMADPAVKLLSGEVSPEQYVGMIRELNDAGLVPSDEAVALRNFEQGGVTEAELQKQLVGLAATRQTGYNFNTGEALSNVVDSVQKNGGHTVSVTTGAVPTAGYAVSLPGFSRAYPIDVNVATGLPNYDHELGDRIVEYVHDNWQELSQPDSFLGIYYSPESKQLYLDVSVVAKKKDAAVQAGRIGNQESVWDVLNMNEVPTGGSGSAERAPGVLSSHGAGAEDLRRRRDEIDRVLGRGSAAARDQGSRPGPGVASFGRGELALPARVPGVEDQQVYLEDAFGNGLRPNIYWNLNSSSTFGRLASVDELSNLRALRRIQGDSAVLSPVADSVEAKQSYAEAYERAVNHQILNDPIAMQVLQGKNDQQIVSWLQATPAGDKHARTLPFRAQNPEAWVGAVRGQVEDYLPTEELRTKALENGHVSYADLEKALPMPQDRPFIHGNRLSEELGKGPVGQFLQAVIDRGMKVLGQMPTDAASRNPYFAHIYHSSVQQQYDQLLEMNKATGRAITANDLDRIQRTARERSLREVRVLLYDLAEQSDLAHMLRFMSPFYSAWQETLTRWSGLLYHNPLFGARAMAVWNAPNRSGFVVNLNTGQREPEVAGGLDRNAAIRVNMPVNLAKKILPKTAYNVLNNMSVVDVPKTGFNLALNGDPWWLPGFGPSVQFPANEVLKDKPTYADRLGWLFPYGTVNNGSFTQDFMAIVPPTWTRRLNSTQQGEDDTTFANLMASIARTEETRYRQGLRKDEPSYGEIKKIATGVMAVRTAANLGLPFSPVFRSPYQKYVELYRQYQQQDATANKSDPNYMSADARWYRDYGPELFALSGHLTRSVAGIPPTDKGEKDYQKYKKLIENVSANGSPELAGLLTGADGAGAFSMDVYRKQLQTSLFPGSKDTQRKRLSTLEFLQDRQAAEGWIKYQQISDAIDTARIARGLPSLQVSEADDLRTIRQALINQLAAQNPGWRQDYETQDSGTFQRRIENLRQVVQDPKLMQRPEIQGVASYIAVRDAAVLALRQRAANGGSGVLSASSNQDLRQAFSAMVGNLVQSNLAFGNTFYRYLDRDSEFLTQNDFVAGEAKLNNG